MKKHFPLPVLAFFLALLTFLLFLWLYGVLGYGNYTILRGDLYIQYIDFISMFLRVLKGQEDFWYTFSLYYGSGTILTYAYYAFSPFNLLYLIDSVPIATMTSVVITLKIALSAATFSLFAKHCLKCLDRYALFFSLCYALSSFTMTMHFNMIWLDAVYMLPVMVLLLFRLVKKGHFLALVPAWAYLFLTNFYMAYIVGVFAVLILLALLILHTDSIKTFDKKHFFSCWLRFILSVILAAGICAAVLIPAAIFLVSHMAQDNFAFEEIGSSVLDIINSMFIGEMPNLDNRAPFLCCGLPVLLLVPFYFSHKAFSLKERLTVAVLLLFYGISMLFLPLFVMMHAFDYPNWYFFRFSFCVIFLLCALSTRYLNSINTEFPLRKLYYYTAGLLFFYSFMIGYGPLNARSFDITNSTGEFAINILFFVLWLILTSLLYHPRRHKKTGKDILPVLCLFLLMIELAINGKLSMEHIGLTPQSETEFNTLCQSEANALSMIPEDDNSLYRICVYGENNSNAPALFGYAGFNTFSSSDDYELRSALYALGISGVNRAITELGYTDVTRMLFGAKYIASIVHPEDSSDSRVSELESFPYSLPFAYMVSDRINDYLPSEDPFANQEKLVSAMTNTEYHFFDRLSLNDLQTGRYNANIQITDTYTIFSKESPMLSGANIIFSAPRIPDAPFYACFSQKNPSAHESAPYILGGNDCHELSTTLSYGCIYSGGNPNGNFDKDMDTIAITFQDGSMNEYPCQNMYFVRLNNSELPAAYDELKSHSMNITSWRGGCISGTAVATTDYPILFTSIPYDKDWTAIVDGQPCSVDAALNGAFLSLRLTPGEHSITLQYEPAGATPGRIISIISIGLYLIIILICCRKKKKA